MSKFKIILSLVICCLAFSMVKGQGDGPKPVKIYLGWTHQFQFAGYYAAKELGYYREAGIEVELVPYDGTLGAESVLNGRYEYGVASAGQLVGSPERDRLKIVSSIFQQSPLALIVKRRDGLNTLKDLEGKRILASSRPWQQ